MASKWVTSWVAFLAFVVDLSLALTCKCAPGETCWPPESAWAALNTSVSGRLLHTILPASVCYESEPNYDPVQCDLVISNWTVPQFHSNDPASIHSPPAANSSCNPIYPNGTSTAGDPLAGSRGCSMGRYPPYVQTVKFAAQWNLRLNVKNTGHGEKSVAFGGLSVWTHHMKDVKHEPSFQPACNSTSYRRSPPHEALTVGAGIQDDEVFQAAAKFNLAVVGGTNSDVGLVGWATGGGHGWLTSEFGMGADNIIQAVIVTPAGDIITTNECQNSDLLWAIRGGGGGTYGVITEVTVKAYPMPQATTWLITATKTSNCGFQGYYTIGGPPSYSQLTFYGFFFLFNKPNGMAEALSRPIISLLTKANGIATYTSQISWAPSFISVWDTLHPPSHAGGGGGATTSRLLTESAFTKDPKQFARVLELVGPNEDGAKGGVSNPTIAGCLSTSSVAVDNALNPAWRDAVVHFYVSSGWSGSLPYPEIQQATDDMTNNKGAALRRLEPNTGAYYNEADTYEPEWQKSFWGSNCKKLLAIKQKYDPDSLLWCPRCAGSEYWFESLDGKLCKV
ncbi:FAD-binding domain-containing protein [Hypoxylon crocopeplum]|nr:FAD-binding domain-containing protein [Hypoxylon crocopeplum]